MQNKPSVAHPFLAYAIFAIAAAFLFFEMGLQVSLSVMGSNLMQDIHLDGASFAIIVSAYFVSYTFMQIPAGLLFDRISARCLITLSLVACACGALLFGLAQTTHMAALGRFLIGFGSAFAYISVLFVAAKWFPSRYFALLVGLAQIFATVGAIGGKVPVAAMVSALGWRTTLESLAGLGAILAVLAWLIVRDYPAREAKLENNQQSVLHNLKLLIHNVQTWAVGLHAFAVWAPMIVFAGSWDVLFLTTLYPTMGKTVAAAAGAVIWLGSGLGSVWLCWWSDRIEKRRLPLLIGAVLGLTSTVIILYVPNISVILMFMLMFLLGVASSGQALSFAVVKDNNPEHVTGTAIGFNNMAVVAGGFLLPPIVGKLLDWRALHIVNQDIVYSVADYRYALVVLPICYVIALISLLGIRETHCRAQH